MFQSALCHFPQPWQFGFQEPATEVMHGIISLHHDVMFFCIIILTLIVWMFRTIFTNFVIPSSYLLSSNQIKPSKIVHNTTLEIVWTLTPALILVFIAVPSFALLYSIDEPVDPAVTLKVIGHQWYWTYEYSDYLNSNGESIVFDSYMIPEEELKKKKNYDY